MRAAKGPEATRRSAEPAAPTEEELEAAAVYTGLRRGARAAREPCGSEGGGEGVGEWRGPSLGVVEPGRPIASPGVAPGRGYRLRLIAGGR